MLQCINCIFKTGNLENIASEANKDKILGKLHYMSKHTSNDRKKRANQAINCPGPLTDP